MTFFSDINRSTPNPTISCFDLILLSYRLAALKWSLDNSAILKSMRVLLKNKSMLPVLECGYFFAKHNWLYLRRLYFFFSLSIITVLLLIFLLTLSYAQIFLAHIIVVGMCFQWGSLKYCDISHFDFSTPAMWLKST